MAEPVERSKGTKIVKPIVYGNTATPFGYKREGDNHTHTWTVFLRMYNAEDPAKFIRKVQFKLHDSYQNSTRVVDAPPFEVTETGWGEFEVQMKIYFIDPNEKPITAFHYLHLHNPKTQLPDGTEQVIIEYYDEIVFQEPTLPMYKVLMAGEGKKHDSRRFYTDINQALRRTKEIAAIARSSIQVEIDDLRESLREAHNLMVQYKNELENESAATTPSNFPA